MHILYLNPNSILGTTGKVLRQRGHVVFFHTTYADALELLQRQNFDAVVIEDEEENAEILDFTARAHQWQPATPVFFANDWGSELSIALEEFFKPGEIFHISSTASMHCETETRS
jgi:CheY-like chemotaxis protein